MPTALEPITFNANRQILIFKYRVPGDERQERLRRRRPWFFGASAICCTLFALLMLLLYAYWPRPPPPPSPPPPSLPPPSAPPAPPAWPPGARGGAPLPPPAMPPEERVRFYEITRAGGGFDEYTREDLPLHDLMYGVFENTVLGRKRNNIHSAVAMDLFFMSNLNIVTFMKLNRCYDAPVQVLREITLFWPVYFSLWDARSVYQELYENPNCVPPDIAWESSNVTLEEVWPVYFASERLRSGVRIAQPTLQYKCRTGVNGCDTSKPGFMQWAAPSAVTEAFVGATDDDYLSHFVAKVITELTYEPSERRDLPFFALREAGADAQGRELVVLNGRVRVFKNIVVEFRNVNGTRPQVEREAERLIAQHMSQFGFRRRLFPIVSLYSSSIHSNWDHMWTGYPSELHLTEFAEQRYTARAFAENRGFGLTPITFRTTTFVVDGRPDLGSATVPSVTGALRLTEASLNFHANFVKTSETFLRFVNDTVTGPVRGLDCQPSWNEARPMMDLRCRAVFAT
jgi:hypothetical protein